MRAGISNSRERIDHLPSYFSLVDKADLASPVDIKLDFRNASSLKGGRILFSIAGNKYRLVVWINYAYHG